MHPFSSPRVAAQVADSVGRDALADAVSRDAQSAERSVASADDGLYERCAYCPRYFGLGRVCPICKATPGFLPIGLRRRQLDAVHLRAAELDRFTAVIAELAEAMDVKQTVALARAIDLLEENLWETRITMLEDIE